METIYIILGVFFILLAGSSIGMFKGKTTTIKGVSFLIYIGIILFLYVKMPNAFYPNLVSYLIIPATLVGGVWFLYDNGDNATSTKNIDPNKDIVLKTTQGNILIKNVNAGVLIFGGSGSGKTTCGVFPILKFFTDTQRAGIIYDYKDGELAEIAKPLLGDRLQIVAIHRANISKRVNVIDPKYLQDEKSINSLVKVLLDNLNDMEQTGKGGNSFFYDSAESLLSAVILRFKMDFPQYCTLPHIIAFILAVDFLEKKEEQTNKGLSFNTENPLEKLKLFLTENTRVKIQASPFLLGMGSERQTASVISTLANALRKIAYPDAFWTLSKNEINLDVNHKNNNSVICFMNEPKNAPAITPLVACLMETTMKQMMIRDAVPSYILIDEGATMKFRGLAETVATMRSFGTATIYCSQDISQGIVRYGKDGFRQITANLSTQIFGKANDPDTAQFYENFMELKKDSTTSKTQSGNTFLGGGKQSTTKSEREIAKIRKDQFIKFRPGQFAFLSNGVQKVVQFPKPNIVSEPLPYSDDLRKNIDLNYNEIIEEMILFAENNLT